MHISSSHQSQPTILYTNCRSLYHKMDELRSLVSTYSHHLFCLCETWLDDSITDNELYILTFNLVHKDRNRNGSGVTFFILDTVPYKVLLHHQYIELLVIELTLNNCNLVCALLYQPPSSDPTVLSHLEDTLDALPPTKLTLWFYWATLTLTLQPVPTTPSSHPFRTSMDLPRSFLHQPGPCNPLQSSLTMSMSPNI